MKIITGYCRLTSASAEEMVCSSDGASGAAVSISRDVIF
ncbi:hypothetical protein ACVWZ6_003381 [Bradyrhizobium sp. GM6.1]